MPFAFEKLLVYQKSVTLTDAVCVATKAFPRGYYFLADQLHPRLITELEEISRMVSGLIKGLNGRTSVERERPID